jgi:hypothetical protein
MGSWQCIKMCGACCHLDPDERPGLEEYLSPVQLEEYLRLVGADGWCINFDKLSRECKIYKNRPRFCRVEPEIFEEMYQVNLEEFNNFAIECCHEQIEGVYGKDTLEMSQYLQSVG